VMLLLIGCTSMWRFLLTMMGGGSEMYVCERERVEGDELECGVGRSTEREVRDLFTYRFNLR
jgi:hypothetical protein